MLFNSLDFAIFLPIVFFIYWIILKNNLKLQNILLLIASYVFYGWWDYRFLSLIFISSCLDYILSIGIYKSENISKRKLLLGISIAVNLGLLGFFKYYNFFLNSFVDTFSFFGKTIQGNSLNIILPVGISFYTFQTLSYTIDVYRKDLKPSKNPIDFFTYVSFFPQLVAGPIERATNLLPQFSKKRQFNLENAKNGINQIIWGLFKKIVIADNCAQYANDIFNNYECYSSFTLFLGGIYFAFQIYGDFSGYSDIAIGTSRLFGFKLMTNFKYPYFSRDIAEFWRRWHISLSTWFRDYVYIPLGGSKGNNLNKIKNTFIIFLISGFWHGANWTFIVWGFLNALYFLPLSLSNSNRKNLNTIASNSFLPKGKELFGILVTFTLTVFGWIFFRAENVSHAFSYIRKIAQFQFSIEKLSIERFAFESLPLILVLVVIEWFARHKEFPLLDMKFPRLKIAFILILILSFGSFSEIQDFIYFKF
ncbi:MBOAT family O-acyltransferase [Aureivirga marina]|uniref:MBOAT family O-acyltransferase n=1 Tax=Aureivirga marina TaxID=1182451 RepID=UPI0018C91E17|nr:MBOAT family protein [Aureivirga marina]